MKCAHASNGARPESPGGPSELFSAFARLAELRRQGIEPLAALIFVVAEWRWRDARRRRADGTSKGKLKSPSDSLRKKWWRENGGDAVNDVVIEIQERYKKPLDHLSNEQQKRVRRSLLWELMDVSVPKSGRPRYGLLYSRNPVIKNRLKNANQVKWARYVLGVKCALFANRHGGSWSCDEFVTRVRTSNPLRKQIERISDVEAIIEAERCLAEDKGISFDETQFRKHYLGKLKTRYTRHRIDLGDIF